MVKKYFKLLVLFRNDDTWTRKSLLRRLKDEEIIDEAISLGYIEQCGITDIGEPQYHITELGIKVRDI